MKKIISTSEKDTYDFAREYAKGLKGGEVIALNGNLGAGKTVFSKGLAFELGITQIVNSPTFAIMKIYPINNTNSSIKQLVHIDAYRLESESDLEAIGAVEYFERDDVVMIIEWAEKIKGILPLKTKSLNLEISNGQNRTITIFDK